MKEYFSHDYVSREDEKIKRLLYAHNMTGYGIYWALVEMLYQNEGYCLFECDRIAFDLHTQSDVIESVICDFELFKIDGNKFYSESVLRRLSLRSEKSEKARTSAFQRWNANAMRTQSDGNAIKEKKSKGKKEYNTQFEDFISLFNSITGKKFRQTDKVKRQYDARVKEGFTKDDFETAITNCKKDKFHIENPGYLTPEFITRADKLERYLNYKQPTSVQAQSTGRILPTYTNDSVVK